MHRHLSDLDTMRQDFIDMIHVQMKTYRDVANKLGIDIFRVRELYAELAPVWEPITVIRNKWRAKQIGGNFWDFYDWVKTTTKKCHYCGITQDELDKLHEIGIKNKRTTRGRTLELDRKIPDEHYSNMSNIVYSCYWCNNAKTDTFSEEEFKIIGKAIEIVWKQRLAASNIPGKKLLTGNQEIILTE